MFTYLNQNIIYIKEFYIKQDMKFYTKPVKKYFRIELNIISSCYYYIIGLEWGADVIGSSREKQYF